MVVGITDFENIEITNFDEFSSYILFWW